MASEAIDRRGRVRPRRRSDDDRIARDGEVLRVPMRFADGAGGRVAKWVPASFADSRQRAVPQAASDPYPITDAMRERAATAREEWLLRLDSTMHRHRVKLSDDDARRYADAMEDPHFDAGAYAYAEMKKRLGARRKPKPALRNQSWQEL